MCPRKTRGLLCPVVMVGWSGLSDGSAVVLLGQLRGFTHCVKNSPGAKAISAATYRGGLFRSSGSVRAVGPPERP